MAGATKLAVSFARSLLAPVRARFKGAIRRKELLDTKVFRGQRSMDSSEVTAEKANLTCPGTISTRTALKSEESSMKQSISPRSTIVVEGNIGCGKAQLLNYFSAFPGIEVCEEPVDLWRNKNGLNLLELMYKDPKANSFAFQQYVLETMLDLHDDGGPRKPSASLLERSIYSARYIFIENLRKSDLLTESEYSRLDRQFQSYLAGSRRTNVDLVLYIRTRPEIAHKRIIQRGRAEELSVSVDYLTQLHNRYEEWLCDGKFPIPAPVMIIDGNLSIEEVRQQSQKVIPANLLPEIFRPSAATV